LPVALVPEEILIAAMGGAVIDGVGQLPTAADAPGVLGEEAIAGASPGTAIEATACVEAAIGDALGLGVGGAIASGD
jgi:hypothetical protein